MKKLFNNVFLDGNKVISYVTHVATIDKGRLVLHGIYSQSTSRQMSKVAQLLDLLIVRSAERPEFEILPIGIQIKNNSHGNK
jgi:hypothetical protein